MRPRDLIVVGAVVLAAGFAAADALRGPAEEREPAPTTEAVQTGPTRPPGPEPEPDAPSGWPSEALPGTLVFTDWNDCRVRAIGLQTGRELQLARFSGTCDLWAAPVGRRIAYALGPASADGLVPFKLADVSAPELELGGYRLPAGVSLAPCIYLVHRRPDIYPEPDRFLPERFLDTKPGTYTWIPFGGGLHHCLGANFAMMQLKAIFSVLLRDFSFELEQSPEYYRNDHSKMVVQLAQPCRVTYRRRKES